MVQSCCAFGCTTRYSKDRGIGFFRFPLNERRRFLWITALRRQNFKPSKSSVLCGKHFCTGRPVRDKNHPDYIPSIFCYSSTKKKIKKPIVKKNSTNNKSAVPIKVNPDLEKPEIVKDVAGEISSVVPIEVRPDLEEIEIIKDMAEKISSETPETESPKIVIVLNCGENVSVPEEMKTKIVSAINPLVSNEVVEASCVKSACEFTTKKPRAGVGQKRKKPESAKATHVPCAKEPYEFVEASCKAPGGENNSYESDKTDTASETRTASVNSTEKAMIGTVDYYDLYVIKAQREKKKIETDLAQAYNELNLLREDVRKLQKEISVRDPIKVILENKDQFKYYTGLSSMETFNQIIHSMEGEVCKSKLPLQTQLLVVLVKLKLNLMHMDLAFRFKIAYNTVQKILNTWIPILEQKHGDIISFFKRKKSKEAKELEKQEKLVKKLKGQTKQKNVPSIEEEQICAVDSIQNWLSESCFLVEH